MYFISVALKDKKPYSGLWRNKVVLINAKTKEVMSFQLGMATDWAYYEARGWTHWIKHVSKKNLIKSLTPPSQHPPHRNDHIQQATQGE